MLTLGETMTIGGKEYVLKGFSHNGLGSITDIEVQLKEPDRWWFCPGSKCVYVGAKPEGNPSVEVTPEYADYLRNKPDGEWELRNDWTYGGIVIGWPHQEEYTVQIVAPIDHGTADRGYRWCKPKAPAYGWREYAVVERKGSYMIDGYGNATSGLNLYKALGRVGFGGVQFEGQRHSAWMMQINYLIDDAGMLMHCEKAGTCKPAVPIKVRFWEAQQ